MLTDKKATIERRLTKSEQLLLKMGQLVECDICHKQVIMNKSWMLTAKRDNGGRFFDKKAVCPACQSSVAKNGDLLVSI